MSKTSILYKDIAPGAAADADISTTAAQPFSQIDLLPDGADEAPIASCEIGQWGLNGTRRIVDTQRVGFWSLFQSGEDCVFAAPPEITVLFDYQHASLGVTLQFDTAAGDFCTSLKIRWYQDNTLKAEGDYTPTSASAFCYQHVENYNKVVITLYSTNLPYRYAKLEKIVFGVYRYFGMEEIRSASIVSEMSILPVELPISTLQWNLDTDDDLEFMFQMKQPVEVRNGDDLIGVYYIDEYSRASKRLYSIACYDAFGVLDESPFSGGVYSGESAIELLTEIVGGYFELVFDGVADMALTGAIRSGSRREAMQQVLFAWGVCASTDGRNSIRVFALPSAEVEVGKDRTFYGVSVETASLVTQVRVTAHTYTENSNGGEEINGAKYDHTETVYTVDNPNVTANDKQNVVEIKDATLVSTSIGQETAQRVYDFYTRRSTSKPRIVWRGERLGDRVTVPNAWDGKNTGNIQRMDIKLSNTVVSDCEILGV